MKLEELYEEISKDFPWDNSDLGAECSKTSDLFVKYIKLWSEESMRHEAMGLKLSELVKEKRDYYSGAAPASVYKEKPFDLKIKTDSGIQKYIDSDKDIMDYKQKMIVQNQKVQVLSSCLDEIKKRGYALKSAIDYWRFVNGG